MFIPEITTTVKVNINTKRLDESISKINNDPIMSSCFGEVAEYFSEAKKELEDMRDPLAKGISENLQSHQQQIISMKHYKSGMMANGVDISSDGVGQYLVGNTASSVDGFPYPLAIEQGTKSHWIAPITFEALHWVENGVSKFSKGHMVSGIKADPFVENSINITEGELDSMVNNYLDKIFE